MARQRKLNAKQKASLEKNLHRAATKVDRGDVKYAIDKAGAKAKPLRTSTFEFIRDMANQVLLLWRVICDWWNGKYKLPWTEVALITAGLLYFVSPFDLIPDFIPIIGFSDDAAAIMGVVRAVGSMLRDYCRIRRLDPTEYGLAPFSRDPRTRNAPKVGAARRSGRSARGKKRSARKLQCCR
jgi:uncharacterized membrane protein YkvA (DUF1232 family)